LENVPYALQSLAQLHKQNLASKHHFPLQQHIYQQQCRYKYLGLLPGLGFIGLSSGLGNLGLELKRPVPPSLAGETPYSLAANAALEVKNKLLILKPIL